MIPKTRLGRWSTKLIVVFFSCFAAFQLLLAFGQRPGETFSAIQFFPSWRF